MKEIVIYTQRVEIVESYQERRDCADQSIPRFFFFFCYIPVPVPNVVQKLEEMISCINPVGIMLTGGNSLVRYGGTAPERDETDRRMIEIALNRSIPIYGFCRGMQSILAYFDCELENIEDHVAVRHQVQGTWGIMEVNSYHNQGCKQIKKPLQIAETAEDGVIEAIECTQYKIMASMWHPERENPYSNSDIQRVTKLFRPDN